MANFLQTIKNKSIQFVEYGTFNPADFLKITGAIGWGLSCGAQLVAIAVNDKIPAKEKKFLLPHEFFDGVINVSLFWLLTSKSKNFGEYLIAKGKVLPAFLKNKFQVKDIYKGLMNNEKGFKEKPFVKRVTAALSQFKTEVGKGFTDYTENLSDYKKEIRTIIDKKHYQELDKIEASFKDKIKEASVVDDFENKVLETFKDNINSLQEVKIENAKKNYAMDPSSYAQNKLNDFIGLFPVLTSIAGSIIAMNLVTPVFRNFIAAEIKNKYYKQGAKPPELQYSTLNSMSINNKTELSSNKAINNYFSLTKAHYGNIKL